MIMPCHGLCAIIKSAIRMGKVAEHSSWESKILSRYLLEEFMCNSDDDDDDNDDGDDNGDDNGNSHNRIS